MPLKVVRYKDRTENGEISLKSTLKSCTEDCTEL